MMSNCAALSGLYGRCPPGESQKVFYARSIVSTFNRFAFAFVVFRDELCENACSLLVILGRACWKSTFSFEFSQSHIIIAHGVALNGENVFALMSLISLRFSFFSLRFWLKP
jgi:hypothetical protein